MRIRNELLVLKSKEVPTVSKRSKQRNGFSLINQIDNRIERGDRFFHIVCRGTITPILARNSTDALSLFNLWCGVRKDFDLGYSDGTCGVVQITTIIPKQFCMFVGRRNRGVCVKHVIIS